MHLRALLGALIAPAVIGLISACAHSDDPSIAACADAPPVPLATAATPSRQPFLGVVVRPNRPAILARLDPLSLEPVSKRVLVGEYHDAWSLSPDASRLALGISAPSPRVGSGRIGIRIVDLEALAVVREVETGIAAEALAWLAPRRLVAALQRGGSVLVDPLTGKILRRWRRFSSPDATARAGDSVVMLFADGMTSARLVVIDAQARLRDVALERVQLGTHDFADGGLAIDSSGARAYVVAADSPVAEVDLRTLRVSYHLRLAGPEASEGATVRARERRARRLGDRRLAVFGRDLAARGGGLSAVPAGVTLVDTREWTACTLVREAGVAVLAGDRLLVYSGPTGSRGQKGVGLRAYSVDAGEAYHLFGTQQVWDVAAAGRRAYVRTPGALHVVDVNSGEILGEISSPPELADVIVSGG